MARLTGLDSPMLELSITGKPYSNSLYPQFPAAGEMPADLAMDIAEAAAQAGFRRILLTGSEPLRHPEILDICYGLGRIRDFLEFGISTGGGPLRNMAPTLKGAGVNLLEIRLETLQTIKYEFISGGKLADVRRGITAAERTGFLIRMMTRLMGGVNDDEIYDFCDLVKRHCFEQWFIELPEDSENHISTDCILTARRRLEEIEPRDGARRFRVDNDAGMICLASQAQLNRVRISADGMLNHHGQSIDLTALSQTARREKLSQALEPEIGFQFSFEIAEQ